MKLLHIDSSPLAGQSVSRELTRRIVTQWPFGPLLQFAPELLLLPQFRPPLMPPPSLPLLPRPWL